jgi:hypothetical protein
MVEAILFSACEEWNDRSKVEIFCKDIRDDDILDIKITHVGDKEFIMASYVKEISPGRHRMVWVTPDIGLIVEEDPKQDPTPVAPPVSPVSPSLPQLELNINLAD